MKSARIFLVEGERKLTPMAETSYVKEDDLQALLANYPDLIPGDQIDFDAPRRWLLVARELGVPGSETETGRWSLDHLFLDQDGIPTFVECKRSSDTRARREVVAQMLDYAANGISYWKIDVLQKAAEETAKKSGKSLESEILNLTESDDPSQVDEYWTKVEQNLKSGTVRLIFVADSIPTELRKLVEFLNEQMNNVEVLAVEVKQFLGGKEQKVIVPRLIGNTETARETKAGRKFTNQDEFLSKCNSEAVPFFTDILNIGHEPGHTTYWGTSGFSIRVYLPKQENLATIAYGFPPNTFQIYFGNLDLPDEQIAALRKEILAINIFKEAPKTLTTKLEGARIPKAREAFDLMLRRVEAICLQDIAISMRKIVLISCASRKRQQKSRARELYISDLFKKELQYAEKLAPDQIFVLSAKYGLVGLDDEIEPYDLTLNTMSSTEIKQWAEGVLRQLSEKTDLQNDQFVFLAGEKYRKYLLPYITNCGNSALRTSDWKTATISQQIERVASDGQ